MHIYIYITKRFLFLSIIVGIHVYTPQYGLIGNLPILQWPAFSLEKVVEKVALDN